MSKSFKESSVRDIAANTKLMLPSSRFDLRGLTGLRANANDGLRAIHALTLKSIVFILHVRALRRLLKSRGEESRTHSIAQIGAEIEVVTVLGSLR